MLAQLEYQAGQAIVWRDAVTRWFHRASGIADAKDRVGQLSGTRSRRSPRSSSGYVVEDVTPWETASGDQRGRVSGARRARATFRFTGPAGPHDIVVQYFDVNTGAARFRVRVGDRDARGMDGGRSHSHAAARRIIVLTTWCGATLRSDPAMTIVVEGTPDGAETAALDYIEIQPPADRKQ